MDEDKIEDILKIRLNLEKVERLENKLGKDIENGNGNGNYNNMDEESTSQIFNFVILLILSLISILQFSQFKILVYLPLFNLVYYSNYFIIL